LRKNAKRAAEAIYPALDNFRLSRVSAVITVTAARVMLEAFEDAFARFLQLFLSPGQFFIGRVVLCGGGTPTATRT
jgi:hypothetical protein